jgi:hypothetical protein
MMGWSPGGFDDADASSATTIASAPGAGKRIIARAAYLSSDTACKVTVSAGAGENAKHHQHVAADGGSVIVPLENDLLIVGDENTALTVSSDSAAAVTGKVWHTIVDV